jgi:hypothetical protein
VECVRRYLIIFKQMKVPRSRADGVSGYRNNVYYIAASYGEVDPKKVVCVCLCGSVAN